MRLNNAQQRRIIVKILRCSNKHANGPQYIKATVTPSLEKAATTESCGIILHLMWNRPWKLWMIFFSPIIGIILIIGHLKVCSCNNWFLLVSDKKLIKKLPENSEIAHNTFDTGSSPVVLNRDMCYIGCRKCYSNGTCLASYRSLYGYCDPLPDPHGTASIGWYGAHFLHRVSANVTRFEYIDYEDWGNGMLKMQFFTL